MRAVRDGAVCMVNPWRCKLLHKKASLAVLSDERNAALYSRRRAAAIAAHSPGRAAWRSATRSSMRPARRSGAVHRGAARAVGAEGQRRVWRQGHRARLANRRRAEWEQAIQTALARAVRGAGARRHPRGAVSDLTATGRLHIIDRIMDTAPFVFDGRLRRRLPHAALDGGAGERDGGRRLIGAHLPRRQTLIARSVRLAGCIARRGKHALCKRHR